MSSTKAKYSLGEEIAHSVSHGLGVIAGIVGLVFLIYLSFEYGDIWHVVSVSIYGASIILLYSASTLYHAVTNLRLKRFFQLMDHAAIFLLIAGTYTPFLLVNLRGPWGWTLFIIIWSIALGGVLLEVLKKERVKWLSLSLYLGLGWMALVAIKPMLELVNTTGLLLLLIGGLLYSLGVIFYVRKQMVYHHAIWHLFVLAASVAHYFAVLYGVVLA
ncbi:PAQR family membrane homeostasis protein TrhA [Aliidiomarina haloalkalitolerans]|uniref:Hemolysin III n=1 Tax=Aliidiomarina haloalkalitolerans TaxID=859059 RepID=A0A432VRE7_9GAMM|nr:hemolysin III family protein [Aliidiomarina haloalkalitolerans]RUO18888.1 hemolysin III [Aliidiomarina haloalkalitolerans]